MTTSLLLGFLLGMRHAIEADHVAAVATLTTRTNSIRQGIQQGAAWGLGHTLTLFLFGGIVLFVTNIVPEEIVRWVELAVGIMLIALGLDVICRLIRERVHFHTHSHRDGAVHFHAHSHKDEKYQDHDATHHEHKHPTGFPIRALLIGLMHGMAGSAALIILTLQSISSQWLGLVYIALFGAGSIAGMSLFSVVVAIPLRAARHLTWAHNSLQATIGAATIALGIFTVLEITIS